jgi:hypothetical protein
MSQHRAALRIVEEESGLAGNLLRPLSARHLDPTSAEREGRIDRARLGNVTGRSRTPQIEMARKMGVQEYPAPSGGCCFLADRNYARRLRDLLDHTDRKEVRVDDIALLKIGRHFRLARDLKLVVGRHEAESRYLQQGVGKRWIGHVADGRGAVVRIEGEPNEDQIVEIASLAARYSRHRDEQRVEVRLRRGGEERLLSVAPADEESVRRRLV